MTAGVLTDAETLQLLTRSIEGSPDGRMAEDDLVRIAQWGNQARINAVLLDMVLAGAVAANVENGEVVFTSSGHKVGILAELAPKG